MLEKIPQLIKSETCLVCDGCCKFENEQTTWRVRCDKLSASKIAPEFLTHDQYLKVHLDFDRVRCCFLSDKNYCSIYEHRPFECQLYPFLILKRESGIFLGLHKICHYVIKERNAKSFAEYIKRLHRFFKKEEVQKFVNENELLANEYIGYEDEIEELFQIV